MRKICTVCKKNKPLDAFYEAPPRYRYGRYCKCKECCREQGRLRYRSNPEHYKKIQEKYLKKNPEARRNTLIKHRYGGKITLKDYDVLHKKQKYRCAICNKSREEVAQKKFHLDHNHRTGQIRGLLCCNCNLALGLLHDDIKILRAMEDYLLEKKT